jgi:hypothetical protein
METEPITLTVLLANARTSKDNFLLLYYSSFDHLDRDEYSTRQCDCHLYHVTLRRRD